MNYSQELLANLQEKTGLSMAKLSQELEVSGSYLSQVNKGERKLSEEIALKIADMLKLSDTEVLNRLNWSHAKSERARKAYAKLITGTAAALVIAPISYLGNFAQCILC
jgi:transcriptional regulator with XRE-family HTH domain